jgi:cobalt/nickel transport system permease protein
MRPDYVDRYSRLDSPVHRTPAAVKLAVAMMVVIATVAMPFRWAWVAGVIVVAMAVAAASRLPMGFMVRRLAMLEPVVVGVSALMLWQPNGIEKFLILISRSTTCLTVMILLSCTTPFAEILEVLRRLRVPSLFVTTLALMYRYLFVMADESERLRRARTSRTLRRDRWLTWRMLGTLIGQLFVRSSERAERIYAAMCARGWK